jgi:hypothetical protein
MCAQKDSGEKVTTSTWMVIKTCPDEQIRPVLFVQPGQRRLDTRTHAFEGAR